MLEAGASRSSRTISTCNTTSAPRTKYMTAVSPIIVGIPSIAITATRPVDALTRRGRRRRQPLPRTSPKARPDTANDTPFTAKVPGTDHRATATPTSGPMNVMTWRIVLTIALACARSRSGTTKGSEAVTPGRVGTPMT